MAEVKNDCINRGYFIRQQAETCQRQAGSDYEVKISTGGVYVGKVIYMVQSKPKMPRFFAPLAAIFGWDK